VYVDDCFVVGDKNEEKDALDDIKKNFSITRSVKIEGFIGCHIDRCGNQVLRNSVLLRKSLHDYMECSVSRDWESIVNKTKSKNRNRNKCYGYCNGTGEMFYHTRVGPRLVSFVSS
jgi:hypothetical protein